MKNNPRPAGTPLPSASLSTFISALDSENADGLLVDLAGRAMTAKLAKKRADGRGGWHRPQPEIDAQLRASLREHVDKGDMVDVINLAAMLHVRGEIYGGAPVPAPKPRPKAKAVRKTAKKRPAAKKPAARKVVKKAAPGATGAKAKLDALVEQATPLFKANPNLDREGLIKKIGRKYERITTFAALRARALGDKASTPAPAKAKAPAKKKPAAETKKAPAAAGKADKPAKGAKGAWVVKAAGKSVGSTIFEKKPGDKISFSTGTFVVLSIDEAKREIQVEDVNAAKPDPDAAPAASAPADEPAAGDTPSTTLESTT